jgi:hypothetical protein
MTLHARTADDERQSLVRLYIVAVLVRAAVGMLAYGLTGYTDVPIVEDARYYEDVGWEIARDWLSGASVDFGVFGQGAETAPLLVALIAIFYYVLGGIRALPLLLLAYSAVTAFVPVYVFRFTRELKATQTVARRAAWLVALSPAFVFWSGALYKEGLALLVLSVAAYHTLKLQARFAATSLLMIAVSVGALWGLRYYLGIMLMLATAAGLLWGQRYQIQQHFARTPVLVRQALIVLIFGAIIISVGVAERTERVLVENDQGLLVDLDVRRTWSAREARSGYLHEATIATPGDALRYFPLGLLYFMTVPFPWQLGTIRQTLIIPENMFWLVLYPVGTIGVSQAWKRNPHGTFFLLLVAGGMCVIYALLAANVGTAYRMRSQVWLLWAPFAAWGWEVWRERRRQARPTVVRRNRDMMRKRPR